MLNLNVIFYIFIVIIALMINYHMEHQEELIFFYSVVDKSTLKKSLENNKHVTVIPEDEKSLYDLINIKKEGFTNFKIASIENFTDNLGKYCIGKKPKCLYCQPKNKYYALVNNINVVGFPFKWVKKIPYSDWNYAAKYQNGLNESNDRLRTLITEPNDIPKNNI
jgi:hypothetical protein